MSGAVKLWRWGERWREDPWSPSMPKPVEEKQYVARPAAEDEAIMRIVKEALHLCRNQLPHRLGDLPEAVRHYRTIVPERPEGGVR